MFKNVQNFGAISFDRKVQRVDYVPPKDILMTFERIGFSLTHRSEARKVVPGGD